MLDLQQDLSTFQITRPIHSIFIGGGTPSLFAPESFARLLRGIQTFCPFEEGLEITLEANPGTFESQKFAEYRALGVNRLSIGVQSFDDRILKRLGRIHDAKEAFRAAEIAHLAGFDNFNLDLMFGLPDATITTSQNDVANAISLKPSHISFYQLTLEPNTFFYKFPPVLPDDESIFATQHACQQLLFQHGFNQYEISAYSKEHRRCQHNLNYWQFGDYLGIGAGAHGKITLAEAAGIIRTQKNKHPELYMKDSGRQVKHIERDEIPLEFLMNQLRLQEGFSLDHYVATTGLDPKTLEPALTNCLNDNLLESTNNHYRCTENGWNFLDTILEKFIP